MLARTKEITLRYSIIFALCLIALLSCKKDSTGPEDIVIISDSFERYGAPSHQGWRVNSDLTSASDDTPTDGGQWSLRLDPGQPPAIGNAVLEIEPSYGDGVYEFSAWVKTSGEGFIRLGVLSLDQIIDSTTATASDSVWTKLIIVDTLSFASGDEIYLELSAGTSEVANWYALFDLAKLVKLPD